MHFNYYRLRWTYSKVQAFQVHLWERDFNRSFYGAVFFSKFMFLLLILNWLRSKKKSLTSEHVCLFQEAWLLFHVLPVSFSSSLFYVFQTSPTNLLFSQPWRPLILYFNNSQCLLQASTLQTRIVVLLVSSSKIWRE